MAYKEKYKLTTVGHLQMIAFTLSFIAVQHLALLDRDGTLCHIASIHHCWQMVGVDEVGMWAGSSKDFN